MSIIYDGSLEEKTIRVFLGEFLPQLLMEDDRLFYLDADLMSCINTDRWAAEHPEKASNCGIAEANMIGIAAGMALEGFRPIVHSFGPFVSRRAFDQVFLSAAYAKNPITVIGSDPGVSAEYNGGTHMPFEDMSLYRAIPEATVIDITDSVMLSAVLRQCADIPGVKYLRTARRACVRVYSDDTEFSIGRAISLREGCDAAILACGMMVAEALKAAEQLEKEGIHAAVVDMFTVKPLDESAVLRYAEKCGAIVTAENHNRIGGLYSAVSELLAEKSPTPVEWVAVDDRFGQVGPIEYLQEQYALTANEIVRKVKLSVARKNKTK